MAGFGALSKLGALDAGQGNSFGAGPSETGDISSTFGSIVSGGGFDVFGSKKPFYSKPSFYISAVALVGVSYLIYKRR